MATDFLLHLLQCRDVHLESGALARGQHLRMIQGAVHRVWVQQFIVAATSASDPDSVVFDWLNELVRASDRGVDVRVLLDPFDAGRVPVSLGAQTFLEACGIPVRVRAESAHAKVLIADDGVLVSSANASNGGLVDNLELGIAADSAEMASVLAADFEDCWGNS